jgi:hypothetical protein
MTGPYQKRLRRILSYPPPTLPCPKRYATSGLHSLKDKQKRLILPSSSLFWVISLAFPLPSLNHVFVALWEYQKVHGQLPTGPADVAELQPIANAMISAADVKKQVLETIPSGLVL